MKTTAMKISSLTLSVILFTAMLTSPEARAQNDNRTASEELGYAGAKGALGIAGLLPSVGPFTANADAAERLRKAQAVIDAGMSSNSPEERLRWQNAGRELRAASRNVTDTREFWLSKSGQFWLRYGAAIGGLYFLADAGGHIYVAAKRASGKTGHIIHPVSFEALNSLEKRLPEFLQLPKTVKAEPAADAMPEFAPGEPARSVSSR